MVTQDIVVGLFPTRIASFSRAVAAQKAQLLPYLIAVRMAPVLPSWFVNLAAPILQVHQHTPVSHQIVSLLLRCAENLCDNPCRPCKCLKRSFAQELNARYQIPLGTHDICVYPVQIPFRYFVISTAIGLQPTNIVLVQAGASLSSLHSWKDLWGPRSIMLLCLCLMAALLPILVRRHWLKVTPGE